VKPRPATPESFALPGRDDRHRFFIDPASGRLLPLIQGGEGEGAAPGAATAADLAALQAQIDAAKNGAVTDAQKAAYLDVLAKLGVTDLDQAAQLIKAKQDADAANQDDLQKAQAEVDRLKGELASAQTLANTNGGAVNEAAKQRLIEHALLRKGMTLDAAAQAAPLVQVGDLDAETAVATVTAAVEQTATTFPQLFTAAAGTPPPPAPGLPGATPPASTGMGGKTMEQLGREVAAQRGLPTRPAPAA